MVEEVAAARITERKKKLVARERERGEREKNEEEEGRWKKRGITREGEERETRDGIPVAREREAIEIEQVM